MWISLPIYLYLRSNLPTLSIHTCVFICTATSVSVYQLVCISKQYIQLLPKVCSLKLRESTSVWHGRLTLKSNVLCREDGMQNRYAGLVSYNNIYKTLFIHICEKREMLFWAAFSFLWKIIGLSIALCWVHLRYHNFFFS